MKLRAQMLNHRLPLAPQPLTDHPAAVPSFKTLLLCRSCRGRKLPFAGYSVVKEPDRRLRDVTRSETLVENTGLEPVTSWLQTRRSPS